MPDNCRVSIVLAFEETFSACYHDGTNWPHMPYRLTPPRFDTGRRNGSLAQRLKKRRKMSMHVFSWQEYASRCRITRGLETAKSTKDRQIRPWCSSPREGNRSFVSTSPKLFVKPGYRAYMSRSLEMGMKVWGVCMYFKQKRLIIVRRLNALEVGTRLRIAAAQ